MSSETPEMQVRIKMKKGVTVLATFLICLWIFIPHSASFISLLPIGQVAKLACDLNHACSSQPFFKKNLEALQLVITTITKCF